jgi:hypothetical protein
MPDTFLGLAVLILLLTPGIIFVMQVDSRRPTRELSALRELISIAGVGTICDITVLVTFGIVRFFFPRVTPNVGGIARVGLPYVRLHFVNIAWWILGLLIAACLLALILGRLWPGVAGRVVSGKIHFTSAWWELFHQKPGTVKYIACELLDDTYLAGYLLTYSTEPDESVDRELTLVKPIRYRARGSTQISELSNVSALSVRASQMKYMTVSYMPAPQQPNAPRQIKPWRDLMSPPG